MRRCSCLAGVDVAVGLKYAAAVALALRLKANEVTLAGLEPAGGGEPRAATLPVCSREQRLAPTWPDTSFAPLA